ncbi:MAG: signal peptidase I [Armatimonadota bacterium]
MLSLINFDNPSFPIILLAVIIALRLAAYVAARPSAGDAEQAAPALTPDDTPDTATPMILEGEEDASPTAEVIPQVAKEEHPSRLASEVLDSALIAVILVFFIIRPFVLQAFFIPSESMVPTLQKGDKLLATKYVYWQHAPWPHDPKRGDVVVFHAPRMALEMLGQTYDAKHPTDYVKRVIGLPGDKIRIVAFDGVYINGELLRETYVNDIPSYNYPISPAGDIAVRSEVRDELMPDLKGRDLVIPPGHLFVMGDNRNSSHDSHIWGLLERKDVIGEAVFIFWPPSRAGLIH